MINRQLLPLALLYASNKQEVDGRTRMQKLIFLIQQEFDTDPPGTYHYIPYDYGPFAKKLYEDLDYLEDRDFIKEKKDSTDEGKVKYRYELTEHGEHQLGNWPDEDLRRVLDMAEEIKTEFNDVNLLDLLDYVYTKYPAYAEESVL